MSLEKGQDLLCLGDSLVDVRAEEEISSSGLLDDLIESWLIDGEVVRVPSVDSGLVEIDNGYSDIGANRSVRVLCIGADVIGTYHFFALERDRGQLNVYNMTPVYRYGLHATSSA